MTPLPMAAKVLMSVTNVEALMAIPCSLEMVGGAKSQLY
jgi:hypothetical protein